MALGLVIFSVGFDLEAPCGRNASWQTLHVVSQKVVVTDHFAVYGLLDVHNCHSRAGVIAVREQRRVDLGTLRDMECGRLKEYVRGQEQRSIDADRQAQLSASEAQLQDMLWSKRQTVKRHREQDLEMRSIVNGDASSFNPFFV